MSPKIAGESYIPTDWLLSCPEPWVVLNTRTDLLGQSESDPQVRAAYDALKKHKKVAELLDQVKTWPQERPLSRAYDPKDSLWKLSILADFSLKRDDKRIDSVAKKILAAQAREPAGFLHGGFDHTDSWDERPYVCISHVMTYALARFGFLDDPRVKRAYEYLLEWQRLDGGWHPNEACLPGGPREKDPSCPFGTVNVLRAVAADPTLRASAVARRGADFVLMCWERRQEPYRPIGFGMGSTFLKIQYPFVQHQLLKTLDTLSNFPNALRDKRFREMLSFVADKQVAGGLFIPEGANKPFAEFDFGQKKAPSAWVTFLIARVKYRLSEQRQTRAEHEKPKKMRAS